jgi:hypothetical protein
MGKNEVVICHPGRVLPLASPRGFIFLIPGMILFISSFSHPSDWLSSQDLLVADPYHVAQQQANPSKPKVRQAPEPLDPPTMSLCHIRVGELNNSVRQLILQGNITFP